MTPKAGLLFVISGPSGVGKDTLIRHLLEKDGNLRKTVSFTTRRPRPGELDGVDYLYVSPDELSTRILEGQVLEHAEYDGNEYATSAAQVDAFRSSGHDTILKIDVRGAEQVREQVSDAIFIFIEPPSMEELERRLAKRKTESERDMAARREIAKTEMSYRPRYDYVVTNDDVDRAADELLEIIQGARKRQT